MEIYSFSKAYRSIVGTLLSMALLLLLVVALITLLGSDEKYRYDILVFFVAPFMFCAFYLDRTFFKIRLTESSFSYKTPLLYNKNWQVEEIEGYTYYKGKLIIVPLKSIWLIFGSVYIPSFKNDTLIAEWSVKKLRDIHEVRREKTGIALKILFSDEDVDKRIKSIWNNEAWFLYGSTVLICILSLVLRFISPWFSSLLLFTIPLIIRIFYRSDGLISLYHRRADPRPGLALPLLIPGFTWVIINRHVNAYLNHEIWLLLAFAVVSFIIPVFLINRRKEVVKIWTQLYILPLYAVAFGCYIFGSVTFLNSELPQGTTQYSSVVTDKYTKKGKRVDYYIEVKPWGPFKKTWITSVSESEYNHISIHHPVIFNYHIGGLGIPWYNYEIPQFTAPQKDAIANP